jgi:uncharacterized repeat protein (TIGR03803 family)
VLAADDDLLYGTTIDGGAFGHGTVFRLTTAGDFEVVRHLDGQVEGRRPFGSVLQASDRNLYGTAAEGGAGGMGVVFRVLLSPHSPEIDSVEPSSGSSAGGASVRISGSHFQTMPQVEIGGNAVTLRDIDHRTVAAIAPAGTPGTAADVSLTNPDGTTDTLSAGWFFDFLDVSALHQFHHAVVAVTRNGISRGCGAGSFCPSVLMTRAQLAVMLLRGAHGADFSPPPATGTVFNDVPAGAFAASWIEELADEGISKGCGSGKFCPDAVVSRAAVAPLMLRAKHGPNYKPPPATGTVYTDVPAGSPFADWIEQFAAEGITSGCGSESFCPNAKLSRGEVSVFIARAFGLN